MDISFDFTGKNFLVTGAGKGIGRQIVLELLSAGASVMAVSRHFCEAEEWGQYKGRLFFSEVDVNDTVLLEQKIADFVSIYGCFSGSVHCAGIAKMMPIKVWDLGSAEEIMKTNVWAGMALLKILSKKKYGLSGMSHIYVSSVSAHRGQMGLSVYGASKAALESFVRCAAHEIATKNQRINSVCFGWIETEMTKNRDNEVPNHLLGRGKTTDAAGIVLFLFSDRARWITGANFVVDGGFLA